MDALWLFFAMGLLGIFLGLGLCALLGRMNERIDDAIDEHEDHYL